MKMTRPCRAVDITTPRKFLLHGLWFGPQKPKRVIVWVHGLGSNLWSKLGIVDRVTDEETSVLVFDNRGHDVISKIRTDSRRAKSSLAGAAHEKFADCIDDIDGAINLARRAGVKNIYLVGHSTGCQKSIYWAYKRKSRGLSAQAGVKGIILLAPISDYSAELMEDENGRLARAIKLARDMVRRGRATELMPTTLSPRPYDAQRFLSLYTPDSIEEIFSYAQPGKNPRILRSVRVPILVVWPKGDEYADRPAEEIVRWFEKHLLGRHKVVVIPGAGHGFGGAEATVAREIKVFVTG